MSSSEKLTLKGTAIWVVCALFFTYEFMLRTVVGTYQHPIMYDLHLSLVTFAIISSTSYQVAYGVMQLPVGIISQKFGLKKTMFFAILFCAVATFGFSLTHHFFAAVIFRVMMGLGSAFGFVCLLIAVYEWMPRNNIGLFIGLSQFIGTMGPMIAAGPLTSISEGSSITWRTIFYVLCFIGIGLALVVFFIVENNRQMTGKFQILSPKMNYWQDIKRLLSQKQTWFIGIYSALIYFSIEYLSENEGKIFLEMNGFSAAFSSYMLTLSWLGYAIGCPLLGFISDKVNRRKPVLIFSAICCLLAMIGIIYFPNSKPLLIFYFLLLGLGASGQSVGFAIMAEQCKENYLAIGLAFNNFMIIIIAAFNAPFIGFLLSSVSKTPHLSIKDYHQGFSFIILLISFSVLIAIFLIKETFCKSIRENSMLTVPNE